MSVVSEKLFYVRTRGRVTGPFNVPALMKMVRRGGLSAVDELSENQIEWTRASQFEQLFPKRAPTFAARYVKPEDAGQAMRMRALVGACPHILQTQQVLLQMLWKRNPATEMPA